VAATQAEIDRLTHKGREADRKIEKQRAEIADAGVEALLGNRPLPTPDEATAEALRVAHATKSACDDAVPLLRHRLAKETEAVRLADADLNSARLDWILAEQDGAASDLIAHLEAAAPILARLRAIDELRKPYAGTAFLGLARRPWASGLAATKLIEAIIPRLLPEQLQEKTFTNLAAAAMAQQAQQMKENVG
jgi:hypothetical protein